MRRTPCATGFPDSRTMARTSRDEKQIPDSQDGWGWNEDYEKEFKTIAHEFGIPKLAIPKLLALHEKTLTGASLVLSTSVEAGMAALKQEYGDKFEERMAGAKRLTDAIFKTPEELALFEKAGWGDHPGFLSVLMRLAPLAAADSSFFTSQGSLDTQQGGLTHEQVRAELADIQTNKDNPRYVGYWKNDPEVMNYVDGQYRKVFGDKKVELT